MAFTDYESFRIQNVSRVKRGAKSVDTMGRDRSSIAYRLAGSSEFFFGGERLVAGAGSVTYLPGKVSFHRQTEGEEELIVLHLKCMEEEAPVIEVTDGRGVSDLFEQMALLWEEKASGYRHRCHALLHLSLAHLAGSAPARERDLIRPGVFLLRDHFDDPRLTVDSLAKSCNISTEYFRRLYGKTYGTSPRRALVEKRVEKAEILLQSGDFSVEAIGELCGFSDAKYFSTVFRKLRGISPREYKKLYNR